VVRVTQTIYHCMNPPYDTRIWAETVPRYMDNLIAAARRSAPSWSRGDGRERTLGECCGDGGGVRL
jgi:hypothetical protein